MNVSASSRRAGITALVGCVLALASAACGPTPPTPPRAELASPSTKDEILELLPTVNDEWTYLRCDGTAGSSPGRHLGQGRRG